MTNKNKNENIINKKKNVKEIKIMIVKSKKDEISMIRKRNL